MMLSLCACAAHGYKNLCVNLMQNARQGAKWPEQEPGVHSLGRASNDRIKCAARTLSGGEGLGHLYPQPPDSAGGLKLSTKFHFYIEFMICYVLL